MSTQPRTGIVWEVIRLGLDDAPKKDFLEKAIQAKKEAVAAALQLWREVLLLDDMVALIAPEEEWVTGWNLGMANETKSASFITAQARILPDRARRSQEIAVEMLVEGESSVMSKNIAEQLREEGYEGLIKDLSVSVGNILSRSERWYRVRAGEYALTENNGAPS